jgi:uncharacterized membrane-anchored protein
MSYATLDRLAEEFSELTFADLMTFVSEVTDGIQCSISVNSDKSTTIYENKLASVFSVWAIARKNENFEKAHQEKAKAA